MKKLLLILCMAITSHAFSQSKLEAFGEVTSYSFRDYAYVLDVNYSINDSFYISSWNSITSGRIKEQGFNYSVTSLLFNWRDKKRNTFSVGYGNINQISYDFNNRAIIVKLRIKLL
jgi:hypothetical protein